MAANGIGSLVFIDYVAADGISKVNSDVYRALLPAHIQSKSFDL